MSVALCFHPGTEGALVNATLNLPGSEILVKDGDAILQTDGDSVSVSDDLLCLSASFTPAAIAEILCNLMGVAGLGRLTLPQQRGGRAQAFWHDGPPQNVDLPALPKIDVGETTKRGMACAIFCLHHRVAREEGRVFITVPMNMGAVTNVAIRLMGAIKVEDVDCQAEGDGFGLTILRAAQPSSFLGKVWKGLCE